MAGESLIDGGDVGSCFPMPAQSKYRHEKVLLEKGDALDVWLRETCCRYAK